MESICLSARTQSASASASPTSQSRVDDLIAQFGLDDASDRRAGSLSGGMQRKLDLDMALVKPPGVLFLDGPITDLDPRSRQWLWQIEWDQHDSGTIAAQWSAAALKRAFGSDTAVITFDNPPLRMRASELLPHAASSPGVGPCRFLFLGRDVARDASLGATWMLVVAIVAALVTIRLYSKAR